MQKETTQTSRSADAVRLPGLRIDESEGRGRGVFAERAFEVGEIIAIDPVLRFADADRESVKQTRLRDYYYIWTSDDDGCFCLGAGSFYNHSYQANAAFRRDFNNETMIFEAIRPIAAGEEITINYGGRDSNDPVDFDIV